MSYEISVADHIDLKQLETKGFRSRGMMPQGARCGQLLILKDIFDIFPGVRLYGLNIKILGWNMPCTGQ